MLIVLIIEPLFRGPGKHFPLKCLSNCETSTLTHIIVTYALYGTPIPFRSTPVDPIGMYKKNAFESANIINGSNNDESTGANRNGVSCFSVDTFTSCLLVAMPKTTHRHCILKIHSKRLTLSIRCRMRFPISSRVNDIFIPAAHPNVIGIASSSTFNT